MGRATIDGVPRWDDRPLVGRADELAHLLAHVDRAVAGRSCAVLLAGDAGVGKTRLLDELCARATGRGVRVLTGHCVDLGDVGLPYLPFVDLLRPVTADPDLATVAARHPAASGLLAGRPGAEPPDPAVESAGDPADLGRPLLPRGLQAPADDGRLQLFESVAALIGELADAGPLLLVLEDVHWADRSSRDLLRYLLARLTDEPVAVVASYRSDDLHRRHPLRPLLAELVRLPGVERMELGPLPDADVGALVRDLAGTAGGVVAARTVDDVVARAEGNAFYAEELVAAGLRGEGLPLGLTDVLLARVEQASPAAQRVLRVAAVAGRQVRHELLAAVSELPAAELEAGLADAVHGHLLVVSDDGRYRFRHALLREAVLADLLPGERVRLHAAVAEYLASTPGAGTAAERAHHLRESNDLAGALTASLEAADEARRVGAPAEQLQQLESALALWRGVADADVRAGRPQWELLMETAAAARRVGELHRAEALLRSALETLGPDGDPADRARAHYTLAQVLARQEPAASLAESEAAMALVPADPPSPVRTWAAATHARALYTSDRFAEATAVAEEALAAADRLGLDSAWADTAVSLALMRGGGEQQIMARVEEALGRARRSGDAEVEMRVLYYVAALMYESGNVAGTLERAQVALDRACELGAEWSFYAAELRHLLVVARYVAGDWDGSLEMADRLARVPDMAAHVRAAGLLVLVGRGDATVADRLAWARGLTARLNEHVLLGLATASAEIDLAAWNGDAETAVSRTREICRRLVEAWGDDRLATLRLDATALGAAADAAAAARLVGNAADAQRWVDDARSLADDARAAMAAYERVAGEPSGIEGRAWMARVEAEEARLLGRADPELWRAAVAAFDYGHVYEQARSRWRLAEALLETDDREAASAEARAAHEVAVRLGAEPLRHAVEALARRGRLDLPLPGAARSADPDTVLTPRETEVLALLAQGRTNRQVGATLYISEKTASVHVSNILAKFGAASRAEAVAIAAAKGLLTRVD